MFFTCLSKALNKKVHNVTLIGVSTKLSYNVNQQFNLSLVSYNCALYFINCKNFKPMLINY